MTEQSSPCLVLSGRRRPHAPPAEGGGLGPASENKAVSRTRALCEHVCPNGPPETRDGGPRPGAASEPVWRPEDGQAPAAGGCDNAQPRLASQTT